MQKLKIVNHGMCFFVFNQTETLVDNKKDAQKGGGKKWKGKDDEMIQDVTKVLLFV
jgi:hypothetical protein